MNYDEMSDFEINKLIAECLFKSYDTMTISVNDKSSVYVDGGDSEFYDYVSGEFDYCNNPNDAWPLLLKLIDDGCTIVIDKESVNGELLNGKSITRKIAELYISRKAD